MGKRQASASDMEECKKIVQRYIDDPDSEPFREPVAWKELGLTDYPLIIKEPMDLGTISTKLENAEYASPKEFARDVKLVWQNCMTYNADGSLFYKIASRFAKKFEKDMAKLYKKMNSGKSSSGSSGTSSSGTGPPTLDDKANFCRLMYEISETQLGHVVQTLDQSCERALDKSNRDEVEINVDIIDPTTFRKLEAFIKDCIKADKASGGGKKKTKREASAASMGAGVNESKRVKTK